jgi:hypothetical protein
MGDTDEKFRKATSRLSPPASVHLIYFTKTFVFNIRHRRGVRNKLACLFLTILYRHVDYLQVNLEPTKTINISCGPSMVGSWPYSQILDRAVKVFFVQTLAFCSTVSDEGKKNVLKYSHLY